MWNKQIAVAVIVLGASGGASAYETGKLTCQNVGQLAAQTLVAKQSGISPDAYLSALNQKLPAEAMVERKLAAEIATAIYQNDAMDGARPDDVYAVFTQDCLSGQEDDRMSGQQEDGTNNQDEDEQ